MKKLLRTALLLGFSIVAIFAQDCANPLLNRTDIQARFGNSSNILNTSRIAGNLSICPFLSGQSVCVSDAGFASLQTFLEDFKRSFTERSQKAAQNRYGGIGEAMKRTNVSDAKMKSMYSLGMLFNHTVLSFNASNATQPYNFTAFYNMVQQMGLNSNKSSQSGQERPKQGGQDHRETQPKGNGPRSLKDANMTRNESEPIGNFSDPGNSSNRTAPHNGSGPQWAPMNKFNATKGNSTPPQRPGNQTGDRNSSSQVNTTNGENESQSGNLRRLQSRDDKEGGFSTVDVRQNWMNLQKNLVEAKSKCAVSVMKHMYFTSCMAAAGNLTALNQSNSTNSTFKLSPDACSGFKSKCVDYFTYSAAAESTRAMMMNANSSFAAQLYAIVTSGNDTTTIFAELNTLATTVLEQINATGSNSTFHKSSSPLVCNNTNSNASDCNYICTKVLNATGFDEDAFNSVESANSTSRRNLDASVSFTIDSSGINPDTSIGDDDAAVVVSVSSVPDSSSGSKVFVSILVAIASLLLMLTA